MEGRRLAFSGLLLQCAGYFIELMLVRVEQTSQARVKQRFTAEFRNNGIEGDLDVHTLVCQNCAPSFRMGFGLTHEIQDRQDRLGAHRENVDFTEIFGKRLLGAVNNVKNGIDLVEKNSHDLGLLLESSRCFGAFQKCFEDFLASIKLIELANVLPEFDRLLKPRGVIQVQNRLPRNPDGRLGHMPGGGIPVRDLAKILVSGERTQKGGFSGVGMTNDDDG